MHLGDGTGFDTGYSPSLFRTSFPGSNSELELLAEIRAGVLILLMSSTGNSAQCSVAAWMGGEFVGEWIHVYV